MTYLTACAGTPRALYPETDPDEAGLAAARYELHVLTSDSGPSEPVEVDAEDFQRAMRVLAREFRPGAQPAESAHWLMEGSLQADLLAEVERERVVRLRPLEDNSPLDQASAAEMTRKYLGLCQQQYGGGDCLGLLADGPTLSREDLRTLGLTLALKDVLKETGVALKGMVSPQALVAMMVWTCCVYLTLWLLPEPVSKAVAAGLTLALLAWLPVHTLWSLMDGWGLLVHEVDRAISFEQVEAAGAKFSKTMGENTAHVLVMVVTAAITGGAARLGAQLAKLPGFALAEARAGAQGMSLVTAGEVEAAAVADEQTVTLMVRRPGGRAAAVAEEAAEGRAGATTIIRHQGGNRQVLFNNNQRWHVPAGRSIKDIPPRDPVGDNLVAAAREIRSGWSLKNMRRQELEAFDTARARGEYWKANLLEAEARGRYVHAQLKRQFPDLKWNHQGVDAVDPNTGIQYEILTRTESNMERHGRRMAEELFRMIGF